MGYVKDSINKLVENMDITKKDQLKKLAEDLNVNGISVAKKSETKSDSRKLLDDLYGEITAEYEYDPTTDPIYASEKKAYEREADRTMRDTLAQANTRTNGFTNSAAITAASQARDYTMSQFADRAAELEDRAYTKRQNQISTKMQLLSALENMEATERANYLEDLDRIEAQETAKKEEARQMVSDMIELGQMPSQELMNATGLSQEYLNAQAKAVIGEMDTASVQRYLNSMGQSIDVDGSWGPATEKAYKAVFGTSSGRYGTGSYSSSSGLNPTSAQVASAYKQILNSISNGSYDNADSLIDQYEPYMNSFQRADIAAAIAQKQGKKINVRA